MHVRTFKTFKNNNLEDSSISGSEFFKQWQFKKTLKFICRKKSMNGINNTDSGTARKQIYHRKDGIVINWGISMCFRKKCGFDIPPWNLLCRDKKKKIP